MNDNSMTLEFVVSNQIIKRVDTNKPVADSLNYLYAHFTFSDDWKGLDKTALFAYGNTNWVQPLNENNTCIVTSDVIKASGFYVGVKGTINGINKRITTNPVMVQVLQSMELEGNVPSVKILESDTLLIDKSGNVARIEIPNIYVTNARYDETNGNLVLTGLNGETIETVNLPIKDILQGVVSVKRAECDSQGRVIVETYATKQDLVEAIEGYNDVVIGKPTIISSKNVTFGSNGSYHSDENKSLIENLVVGRDYQDNGETNTQFKNGSIVNVSVDKGGYVILEGYRNYSSYKFIVNGIESDNLTGTNTSDIAKYPQLIKIVATSPTNDNYYISLDINKTIVKTINQRIDENELKRIDVTYYIDDNRKIFNQEDLQYIVDKGIDTKELSKIYINLRVEYEDGTTDEVLVFSDVNMGEEGNQYTFANNKFEIGIYEDSLDSIYVKELHFANALDMNRIYLSKYDASVKEKNLQDQIDAINSKADVVAVVGTKAQLDLIDKSKLTDKDIVKVLKDETQNNAQAYYQYSTSTKAFTLIGTIAESYTKGESDNKFSTKEDYNGLVQDLDDLDERVTTNENDIDNLKNGLSGKLDKITGSLRVYGTDNNGNQVAYTLNTNATNYSIVQRTSSGNVVTGTPTNDTDSVPKKYLEDTTYNKDQVKELITTQVITLASGTTTQELADDKIYKISGDCLSFTPSFASNIDESYCAEVRFTSGATPTEIGSGTNDKFDGFDCEAGDFVPMPYTNYRLIYSKGNNGMVIIVARG